MTDVQRPKRVLFFISGTMPTQEDYDAAKAFGPGVMFRNANLVATDGPIENADEVAGAVPDNYKTAYDKRGDVDKYNEMKAEQDEAAGTAALFSRGEQKPSLGERLTGQRELDERKTQSGEVRGPKTEVPESGWSSGQSGEQAGGQSGEQAGGDQGGAKMPTNPAATTTTAAKQPA